MKIDELDFSILTILNERSPLWKKAIHTTIEEDIASFPLEHAPTLQTSGRRIETLLQEGLVKQVITGGDDDLDRDLIIGYTLTPAGKEARQAKQAMLLKEAVRGAIVPDGPDPPDKPVLVALVQAECGFDESEKEAIEQYSRDEILSFITIRHAHRNAMDVLCIKEDTRLPALLEDNEVLARAMGIL